MIFNSWFNHTKNIFTFGKLFLADQRQSPLLFVEDTLEPGICSACFILTHSMTFFVMQLSKFSRFLTCNKIKISTNSFHYLLDLFSARRWLKFFRHKKVIEWWKNYFLLTVLKIFSEFSSSKWHKAENSRFFKFISINIFSKMVKKSHVPPVVSKCSTVWMCK